MLVLGEIRIQDIGEIPKSGSVACAVDPEGTPSSTLFILCGGHQLIWRSDPPSLLGVLLLGTWEAAVDTRSWV